MVGQRHDRLERGRIDRRRRRRIDDAGAALRTRERNRDREGVCRMEAARTAGAERGAMSERERQGRQRPLVAPREPHSGEVHHPRSTREHARELTIFFIKDQQRIDGRRDAANRGIEFAAHRIDRARRRKPEPPQTLDQRRNRHAPSSARTAAGHSRNRLRLGSRKPLREEFA
jgi:hypothetical protein